MSWHPGRLLCFLRGAHDIDKMAMRCVTCNEPIVRISISALDLTGSYVVHQVARKNNAEVNRSSTQRRSADPPLRHDARDAGGHPRR